MRQPAVRGELPAHDLLGDLPDVIEQAVADGDLGDLLEVERLSLAPQNLDGGFGESHAFLRLSKIRRTLRVLYGAHRLAARRSPVNG